MQKYDILETRFRMRVGSGSDPSERLAVRRLKKYFSDISFLLSVKYVYLQP